MIIAEIGQNHLGDMDLACKLISLAWENGADLAKFQLYDSLKLYGEKQKEELTFDQAEELFNFGQGIGIEVFFSVFDVRRVVWCEEIGVKHYKLACDYHLDRKLLDMIVYGKIIASTSHIAYNPRVRFIYCVSRYPTELKDVDWSLIAYYRGFSDHTIGLDASKIALARGAEIIEKHFAIDHSTGVDAPWSMVPSELAELKRFETICKTVL